MSREIVVVNKSKLVSDEDAKTMTEVVNFQLNQQVLPAWGLPAVSVTFASSTAPEVIGSYIIGIMDDSDTADALGWHSEDDKGNIFGRVFAKPVLDNGGDALTKQLSVASVLSHEVIEAAIDPDINDWAEDSTGHLWAKEAADPVENDSYLVKAAEGVEATCSNFVLPEFFDAQPPHGAKFDYLGKLSKPFSLSKGGYCVLMKGGKVTQKFGESYPSWKKASKNSELARTHRRVQQAN